MTEREIGTGIETYFAPAERATAQELAEQEAVFASNSVARSLLHAMPYLAVAVNEHRQVIAVNTELMALLGLSDPASLIGRRPGEVVGCQHVADGPGGCGTSPYCRSCGAVLAILECLQTHQPVVRECLVAVADGGDGGALDLNVQATYVSIDGLGCVVVALQDISSDKRRRVLERTFFHDVLNTAGGVLGFARILVEGETDPDEEHEFKEIVYQLSEQMVEEITAHRALLQAERGELQMQWTEVSVPALVQLVAAGYRKRPECEGLELRILDCAEVVIETDLHLVRRVLGNMVKNAIEATDPGGVVTMGADASDSSIMLWVQNPAVMPDDVKRQLFKRSFSTKAAQGRGIGTYSMKLLTERYLAGRVEFTSEEPHGTRFTVTLPLRRFSQ